jgi:hypothetical protein
MIIILLCFVHDRSHTLSQRDWKSLYVFPLSGKYADAMVLGVYVLALDLLKLALNSFNLVILYAHTSAQRVWPTNYFLKCTSGCSMAILTLERL